MDKQLYAQKKHTQNENETESWVVLNPKHAIFKGHFPENPILPGVILIDIFKKEAENYSQEKLLISHIKTVKFLQVVKVEEETSLKLLFIFKTSESKLHLNGKVFDAKNNLVAKLQLELTSFE